MVVLGIHAREWISPAVTLQLIHRIVKACSQTKALDVYIVPMANPDGYIHTWTTDRFWRKNRRNNPGSNCVGVDLNRNWDFHFGVGASNNPCSEVFKGSASFSEPETKALSETMKQVASKGNLKLVVALHSYGQVLVYPWGWTTDPAPDTSAMIRIGKLFSRNARKSFKTKFDVLNSAKAFGLISGATDDWAKSVLKTKFAYTLELRDKGNMNFVLGADQILPSGKEVWRGLKRVFKAVK